MQEFERVRLDVAGLGVTVTSWYEADKQRWRASAPAHSHLLTNADADPITGATRERAIKAICERLGQRFRTIAAQRRR